MDRDIGVRGLTLSKRYHRATLDALDLMGLGTALSTLQLHGVASVGLW